MLFLSVKKIDIGSSHLRIKGQVIDFAIQYETFIDGEWFPVVRYDTSHGFAHRDIMNIRAEKGKTPLSLARRSRSAQRPVDELKSSRSQPRGFA